jgi:hypothetical protein
MKCEIDNDFYCAADMYKDGYCDLHDEECGGHGSCKHCHRKHPTPEQFREEYGKECPDDGPVWMRRGHYDYSFSEPLTTATYQWDLITFREAKGFQNHYPELSGCIVCACTPFGKPDKDWRPE